VHRDAGNGKPNATVTVLDTMDYRSRSVLCDSKAKAVQVGLAGAISAGQVEWLESLHKAEGIHFVLSHYLPFESVERPQLNDAAKAENMHSCDTTFGTKCLGARLVATLPAATFIYGHVHKPFEQESIASRHGTNECTPEDRADKEKQGSACECINEVALPLVRLPSLMDNKQYVVFENGSFQAKQVAPRTLSSLQPFAVSCNTCIERFAELVEIEQNVACLKQREAAPNTKCADLTTAFKAREAEANDLCNGVPTAWQTNHDADWQKVRPVCETWLPTEQWRCILREQASALAATVPAAKRPAYAAALLANVHTINLGNKKACDAKR
jgi:hypothetical protein